MQDYNNTMVMASLKVQNAGSVMLAALSDEFRALVLAVENSNKKS